MKLHHLSAVLFASMLSGCVQEGANQIDLSGVIDDIALSNLETQQEYSIEFTYEVDRQLDVSNAYVVDTPSDLGHQFYVFPDQKAVIEITTDNSDTSFQTDISVHLFDLNLAEGGIDAWLNNQTGDTLILDAPEPIQSIDLTQEQFTIQTAYLVERMTSAGGEEYDHYEVMLYIDSSYVSGAYNLLNFTTTLDVYVAADNNTI